MNKRIIVIVISPISRRLLTLRFTGNPNVPLKGTEKGCLHVGQFNIEPALSEFKFLIIRHKMINLLNFFAVQSKSLVKKIIAQPHYGPL